MATVVGPDIDQRIKELEAQLKEEELRDRKSPRALIAQSFLTALPIILTIGLGFLANYVQSRQQHEKQIAVLAQQGGLERQKQEQLAQQEQLARSEEAIRAYRLQEREIDANATASESRFSQEQMTLRSQHIAQQLQQAREFNQSLERQRRQNESDLILQVIRVGDLAVARANIEFLLSAGLVSDPGGRIASAAVQRPPVLPTASGDLQVRVPDVQSPEGQRMLERLANSEPATNRPATERRGPLQELISAISRERSAYSVRELAAILAIVEDESNGTFRSLPDRCGPGLVRTLTRAEPPAQLSEEQCFELIYGASTRLGRSLGNREAGDGYRFRGRGYFRVTGRANYQRLASQWNTDYVAQPDLLGQPIHAFRAVLTFSERGLQSLRARPDITAAPADFPYAAALRPLVTTVTGDRRSERIERIANRAEQIELLLRETLTPVSAAS